MISVTEEKLRSLLDTLIYEVAYDSISEDYSKSNVYIEHIIQECKKFP